MKNLKLMNNVRYLFFNNNRYVSFFTGFLFSLLVRDFFSSDSNCYHNIAGWVGLIIGFLSIPWTVISNKYQYFYRKYKDKRGTWNEITEQRDGNKVLFWHPTIWEGPIYFIPVFLIFGMICLNKGNKLKSQTQAGLHKEIVEELGSTNTFLKEKMDRQNFQIDSLIRIVKDLREDIKLLENSQKKK